jgi:flagellar biosynthesis/type III secretory pathway protein FliH
MKEPTIEITYNGMKYYSEVALAENQLKWYNLGKAVGIEAGKKSNGYSSDDIKQLHTDMNHIHHLWYDKGYNAGKSEGYKEGYDDASIKYFDEYSVKMEEKNKSRYDAGYNDGYEQCKHDGISTKEIPGEYLSRIEEAYDDGYKEGYTDCREVAKMLNKYGIDEDGPCNDCKEEPGRDEEDGDYVGPEHPEYDKGYYAGWEDGKNHIMQFIGNESSR